MKKTNEQGSIYDMLLHPLRRVLRRHRHAHTSACSHLVTLGVVAALGATACSPTSTNSGRSGQSLASDAPSYGIEPTAIPHALYLSSEVTSVAYFTPGTKFIEVVIMETPPSSSDFYEVNINSTTSYDVHGVDGFGADTLYVLGRARDNSVVIECWQLPSMPGQYRTNWIASASQMSNPKPGPAPVGGVFIPPAQRQANGGFLREEVYRSSLAGQSDSLDVDPEGRFAVLGDWTSGIIYQVALDGSNSTSVIFQDPAILPPGTVVNAMSIWRHATEGRKLFVSAEFAPENADILLISDPEGDGIWNFNSLLSLASYHAAGLPEAWAETYTSYLPGVFPNDS